MMKLRPNKYRRSVIVLLVVALVLLIGIRVWQNQDFKVKYHFYRMEYCRDRIYFNPQPIGNGLAALEINERQEHNFNYHQQKLVDLGAIVTFRYDCQHIRNSTPQCMALLKKLRTHPLVYDFSRTLKNLHGATEITFWCLPENQDKLKKFLTSQDVENQDNNASDPSTLMP